MKRNLPRPQTSDPSGWMPQTPAQPAQLDTLSGPWAYDPRNATDSVIFVLLGRDDPEPGLSWTEPVTGNAAWSSRPQVQFVFLRANSDVDMETEYKKTVIQLPLGDRSYWLPRMFFALNSIDELRASGSWLANYLDSWSETVPTLGLTSGDNSTTRRTLLFDGEVPEGGLRGPVDQVHGACEGVDGTCGVLVNMGVACAISGANDERAGAVRRDVSGKIALVHQGLCPIGVKVNSAKEAGAVGVVVYSDGSNPTGDAFVDSEPSDLSGLPVMFLPDPQGHYVMQRVVLQRETIAASMFNRTSFPWAFGIDRSGNLRRLVRGEGSVAAAVLEAMYYDYEDVVARSTTVGDAAGDVVVNVLGGTGATRASVRLPDEVMQRPNKGLWLTVELQCPDRMEENCPRTSQTLEVMVCDAVTGTAGPENTGFCNGRSTLIAQVHTAAGREMTAVMDASPFLGAVIPKSPGAYMHLYLTGMSGLLPLVRLVFLPATTGDLVPFRVTEVASAMKDHDRPSVEMSVPRGVESLSLAVFLTGLPAPLTRNGTRRPQPPQEFQFKVCYDGSTCHLEEPYSLYTPDELWCSNQTLTKMGYHTVPNQLGDWYTGRPGWCPGRPVLPMQRSFLHSPPASGAKVSITCLRTNDTASSMPTPLSAPGDEGHVDLKAFLVMYGSPPAAPSPVDVDFLPLPDDENNKILTVRLLNKSNASELVDAIVRWPQRKQSFGRAPTQGYRLTVQSADLGVQQSFLFTLKETDKAGLYLGADNDAAVGQNGGSPANSSVRVLLSGLAPAASYVISVSTINAIAPGLPTSKTVVVPVVSAVAQSPSASRSLPPPAPTAALVPPVPDASGSDSGSSAPQPPSPSKRSPYTHDIALASGLAAGLALLAAIVGMFVYLTRRLSASSRFHSLQEPSATVTPSGLSLEEGGHAAGVAVAV